jgi:hypothetical protein
VSGISSGDDGSSARDDYAQSGLTQRSGSKSNQGRVAALRRPRASLVPLIQIGYTRLVVEEDRIGMHSRSDQKRFSPWAPRSRLFTLPRQTAPMRSTPLVVGVKALAYRECVMAVMATGSSAGCSQSSPDSFSPSVFSDH